MTSPARCSYVRPDGSRCNAYAIAGGDVCYFHSQRTIAKKVPEKMDIITAAMEPDVFGSFFQPIESWVPWFACWASIFGIPLLDPDDQKLFQESTGRQTPREGGYDEAYIIAGRRSGKSKTAAFLAAYNAIYGGWETRVGPGEKFWIFCVATDRPQAGIVFHYIKSMLGKFPDRIVRETSDEIELDNGAVISVKTASYRALRGYACAFCVLDELCFFRDEHSANPAGEIVTAILPAMLPGAKLLGISSPFAKFGLVYELYKEEFGREDSDRLIWKASTRTMNPSYRQSIIDRLLRKDRVLYTSEYMAEWREDVETFIPEAMVDLYCSNSVQGPKAGVHYVAFMDPSGGRSDSFTLAIAHVENEKIWLDFLAEHEPPFTPSEVVLEYSGVLQHYGIKEVVSDRYAGVWVQDAFKKYQINVAFSDLVASDLYAELQPRLSSGQVQLLNHDRLKLQLRQLERRPQPGGRDRISHPSLSGFHDDCANAVAGAVIYAVKSLRNVWGVREQEAHLPVVEHTLPKRLQLPQTSELRKSANAKTEWEDWLKETEEGVCTPVRHGPWD